MLKLEFSRLFRSKAFWFSILVGIGFSIAVFCGRSITLAKNLMEIKDKTDFGMMLLKKEDYFASVFETWMGIDDSNGIQYLYFFILPILAAIPYSASFCWDKRSGFINQIATRGDKKKYYRTKVIVVFVSGGIVAVLPLISNLLLCMSFFPLEELVSATRYFGVAPFGVFADLFYSAPFVYVGIYILFDFTFIGLLNCISLIVSFFDENIFLVVLSPFIVYFTLHTVSAWILGNVDFSPIHYVCFSRFYENAVGIVAMEMAVLLLLPFLFIRRYKMDLL